MSGTGGAALRFAREVRSSERERLADGRHANPHGVLGVHPVPEEKGGGLVVRAFHPEADGAECVLPDGPTLEMAPLGRGLFAAVADACPLPIHPTLRFRFADGGIDERVDPYSFLPTLGDQDLHFFNEGTHRSLWSVLGAHRRSVDGVEGVSFAVWAPTASRVSVVGDLCRWDGRVLPMRTLGSSGIWELFVPGLCDGAHYKYEIRTATGALRLKADPMALHSEAPPGAASRVYTSGYRWSDGAWMESRPSRDPQREPMAVYEVHLGSWARVPEEGNRPLTYREIAPRLVEYASRFGFTHLELLPVTEHPFDGSWGYQTTGYFAPTSRYGEPDDFRYFVDCCHQAGIGVILDWVPAHFPRDDFALRRFDGTALYEHEDPRLGEHPDWGTLIFNYGRDEVVGFLIASALFWLEDLHVDGLRVDAVASMLYRDYSRGEGDWLPNRYGGRENLEAVAFLKALNESVRSRQPGCFTVAEESTAWPGVTTPVEHGGLGFTLKWNMGWMHDTLRHFARDPVHRRWHHEELTFAMLYEYSERFLMPLSHDEVVHGKGSLMEKMPGDLWQKLANLRLLLAYQYTRPGKKLLFQGNEIGAWREWDHTSSLDWHLTEERERAGLGRFLEDLGRLYLECSCLWRRDPDPEGYQWIEPDDRSTSVLSYLRHDGVEHLAVVLNLTSVPRDEYRLGVPRAGRYRVVLCSDEERYFGSGYEISREYATEAVPLHGFGQSLRIGLPPLGALVLQPLD